MSIEANKYAGNVPTDLVYWENTTEPSFPSHIPELLENVFSNMSNKELWELRKVSKSWNEEACRTLTMRSSPIHQSDGIPCFSSIKCKQLFDMVSESSGRGKDILMKDVQISPFKDWPSELISNENPFRVFGDKVKRLKIKEDGNFVLLNRFVAHEDALCPNIEALDYYASAYHTEQSWTCHVLKSRLKLKEVRFNCLNEGSKIFPQQIHVFEYILKSSPHLVRIHMNSDNSQVMKEFFKILQKLSLMRMQLKSLSIDTRDFSHLEEFKKCKFSNNLKYLKLHYYMEDTEEDIQMDKHKSECVLMKILGILASFLEELEIEFTNENTEDGSFSYPNSLEDLPMMQNLKVLRVKNCVVGSLRQLEYIKKVPYLKILKLHSVDADISFTDLIDHLSQSEFIHSNLESIEFEDEDKFMCITDQSMIPYLNKMFPRFSHLWISKIYGLMDVSQMESVKVLEIDLSGIGREDLTEAFNFLAKLPKLETLIFYHLDGPLYEFPKDSWLIQLIDAPKLRTVLFYGFSMGTENHYEFEDEKNIQWEKLKRQGKWPKVAESGDWVEDHLAEEIAVKFANKNIEFLIQRGKKLSKFNMLNDEYF